MKKILVLLLSFLVSFAGKAVKPPLSLGFQIGTTFNFGCDKKFRWGINTGLGLMYNQKVYRTLHFSPSLYLSMRVGYHTFGSPMKTELNKGEVKSWNYFGAVTFLPVQFGCIEVNKNRSYIGKPQYYFSNHFTPIFTNDYIGSLAVGTSIVYNVKAKGFQRVGTLDLGCYNLSINYINDGAAPFSLFGRVLADMRDRWFTGGVVISYFHHSLVASKGSAFPLNIEFSYNKFTGHSPNSYEISNDLFLSEVSYSDTSEQLYNFGAYQIKGIIMCPNDFFVGGGLMMIDNYALDLQHLLHYSQYYSHHISPNTTKKRMPRLGLTVISGYTNK